MKIKFEGISLGIILSIIFLILKLCKIIEWSWLWVFAPILIEVLLCILVIIIAGIIVLIKIIHENHKYNKYRKGLHNARIKGEKNGKKR